jgi:UPF0716 protein FxsA
MPAILVAAFLVVPLIELAVIIQVGQLVGVWWTVAALVMVSLAGAWLVRREGTRAWSNFRIALANGRVPTDEVLEGALVLFGGALMLTPGFATDVLGVMLMIPLIRRLVATAIKRRLGARFSVATMSGGGRARRRPDDVIDVRVINVERDAAARNGEINSRDSG